MSIVTVHIDGLDHECELIELVEQIPNLMLIILAGSIFPPPVVCNDLFGKGVMDCGMSGGAEWRPFQINKDEYEGLKNALSAKHNVDFRSIDKLEGLVIFEKWTKAATPYLRVS